MSGACCGRPNFIARASRRRRAKSPPAALEAIEDRCIRDAVALQEAAGLKAITDGEFRRAFWHVDFLTGFEGIVRDAIELRRQLQGRAWRDRQHLLDAGGEGQNPPAEADHGRPFRLAKATDQAHCQDSAFRRRPISICAAGARWSTRTVYPDMEEFWADIVKAYREEIADLVAAGCTYLQLDDVSISYLCDRDIRAQIAPRRRGPGPAPAEICQRAERHYRRPAGRI